MDKKILTRVLRYHMKKESSKSRDDKTSTANLISKKKYSTRYGEERDPFEVARRRMVTEQLIPKGIKDDQILAAMSRVPRHLFVSPGMEYQAYEDRPLQVGFGQTISQPLIVAMMTEELHLTGVERVLEIGTGSGYQAAILAELAKEVYTIERLSDLSSRAGQVLSNLKYKNISLKVGDGTLGWVDKAPFDRIIVTAGAPCVPEALQMQLTDGGMLVIPVGDKDLQKLEVITRKGERYDKRVVTHCRLVKLVGDQGWNVND